MSDALRVLDGFHPWAPGPDITPGEVLDRYNVPKAGLLHAAGISYYFQCLVGDGAPAGIWAYSHIHDDEMQALLAASGPDEFDDLSDELLRGRWVTVAIAVNDQILDSTIMDVGTSDSAMAVAQRMLDRWKEQQMAYVSAGPGLKAAIG